MLLRTAGDTGAKNCSSVFAEENYRGHLGYKKCLYIVTLEFIVLLALYVDIY